MMPQLTSLLLKLRSRDLSQLSLGGEPENHPAEAASVDDPNYEVTVYYIIDVLP